MTCLYCKHWQFPTESLYQGMHTHGYCMLVGLTKETTPDHECKQCEYQCPSSELISAAMRAMQLNRTKKFGDKMNDQSKETQIKVLQEQIDALVASDATPQTSLTQKDVDSVCADLLQSQPTASVGSFLRPVAQVKYELMAIVNGQAVLKRPNGTIFLMDTAEWKFTL